MAHSLTIDRLRSTYVVPRDHPAPEDVRRELDELARKYVADSCGRALKTRFDPRDPSVWLIDKISLDLLMDLNAAEPDEVAGFWAGKIAESVARTIASGEDGERVMRFANRAEYLAYFLRDLAAGTAWNKWHYRQFESLRSLPAGAAIREAVFREPELAEPVLLHLVRTNRFAGVTKSISEKDKGILLRLCSPEVTAPSQKCFQTACAMWITLPVGATDALDLYLKVRSEFPELAAAEVHGAAQYLTIVTQWAQSSQWGEILADITAGRVPQEWQSPDAQERETTQYLISLATKDPVWPSRLAEVAAFVSRKEINSTEKPTATSAKTDLRFSSPMGGVFLLLPTLIANRALLAAYGGVEDAILRYLLLGASVQQSLGEFRDDKALAVAAGLTDPPESFLKQAASKTTFDLSSVDLLPEDAAGAHTCWPEIDLEPALRAEVARAAAVLLRSFARALPGLGRTSFDYLWKNILSGEAAITLLPGRILVELAPRPLEIVLRMAGLRDLCFTPPWMPDTEILITFGQQ